jgi:glycerate dehydrogenase
MAEGNLKWHGVVLDMDTIDTAGNINIGPLQAVLHPLHVRHLTAPDELHLALANMDVVILNKVKLDRTALRANRHIKLIALTATGTNNIDLDAAREFGIAVCNVRAYATPSVVQHVFALLLSLVTRLPDIHAAMQHDEWSHSPHFSLLNYPVHELAGKTLGIVGYGELGRAVAKIAECFDMRVRIARRSEADTRAGRVPLHELLPQVDVLSLHCPLTPETHNLIGERELTLMKSSALLINTARGGVVNEQALLHALQNKMIAGAGIDVLSVEPPPADHVLLQYKQPNLIITPHVAWASVESRQRCINEVAANVAAFKRGEIRNRV